MRRIFLLATCIILNYTAFTQELELTPRIQAQMPGEKSAAITKNSSKEIPIKNSISNGNFLKSISSNQLSYVWGKYLSTSYNDRFYSSAIDNNGNVISVGSIGVGSSDVDAFIYKCDASGTKLWSAKPATSSNNDEILDVTTDNNGNIFITGSFNNSAFDSQIYSQGNWDTFVAKYDPNGTLIWAKRGGGTDEDYGCGIKTDGNGNVYVVGFFNGTASFSGTSLTSSSQGDMFIAKYNGANGNLEWIRNGNVGENNFLYGIGVDMTGNVYVGTKFSGSVNFSGSPTVSSIGGEDMLLIKYNANGNFQWIKTGGGSGDDGINRTVVCPDGNILIAGYFRGTAQFGAKTLTSHGSFDIYAAKYSPSGNLLWAKQFGGTGSQSAWSLCTDEKSNCYLTGWFSGTGAFDNTTIYSTGGSDAYLIKYDKNGDLIWVETIATGADSQLGCGVSVSGNEIAVVGRYKGESYIYGSTFTNAGGEDGFIAKFVQSEDPNIQVTVNPNLLISTPIVKTGQSIVFSGKQFSPTGKVDLVFTGEGIIDPVSNLSVDVYGNFTYTLVVPSSQNTGTYQITATDKVSGVSSIKSFQVVQNQTTIVDDFLKITQPNMSKIRYAGDPITIAWEDEAKYNVNPIYNLKDSYKVEYQKNTNNSSGAWLLIGNVQGTNPGYGKILHSSVFTPQDAGTYTFRVTDNYYPNRSATTPGFDVTGSVSQNIRVDFKWDYHSKLTGGSPEGVAADGFARFYIVVDDLNVTGANKIQKVKISLSDPDGYMVPKYLGKVMYSSVQNNNEYAWEATNASTISAEKTSSNPDGKYWFWYVAPDDFARNQGDWDKGERLITATINITFSDGKSLTTPIKKEIKIARPPVMLVHGLNSSGDECWKNFKIGDKLYYQDTRFKITPVAINLGPTAHFSVNASHLLASSTDKSSFNYTIEKMRDAGFACNRVDYICHSMGGCVARTAAEDLKFKVQQNYNKGYINKLITLDTPHNGSSLANLLDDIRFDTEKADPIFNTLKVLNNFFTRTEGQYQVVDAISDLRYKGDKKFQITPISSHLIGCVTTCDKFNPLFKGELYLLKILLKLEGDDVCSAYGNFFSSRGYEADFMQQSDGIVSLLSQLSAKPTDLIVDAWTIYANLMHSDILGPAPTGSPIVGNEVNKLLNTEIQSSYFDFIPATAASTTKAAPILPVKTFDIVEDRIKILYPKPNSVYNSGDTMTIKLLVDTLGLKNFALTFQDQYFFDKPTKTNLAYKLIVSPEYIEGQSISVLGGYSIQGSSSISNASTNLTIKPVGQIVDFNVKPEVFVIEKTKSRRPNYEAIFPNAITQLGYTDKLSVKINNTDLLAYDSGTNEFKGLAKGSTQAAITYKGITKTVFFEIIQTEAPVGDPVTGIEEMPVAPNNNSKIKVYPNPVSDELVIEYSGYAPFDITNAQGQVIINGKITDKITISTSGYAPGIYFIHVYSNNSTEAQKFIKK